MSKEPNRAAALLALALATTFSAATAAGLPGMAADPCAYTRATGVVNERCARARWAGYEGIGATPAPILQRLKADKKNCSLVAKRVGEWKKLGSDYKTALANAASEVFDLGKEQGVWMDLTGCVQKESKDVANYIHTNL
ncbi:hypothetical protein [Crenobacter cavernae]|uniref:hypothetical protein n=1 Tax=Crenobacter cavernae TaxID=2290923 RepID=UPI00100F9001|nr:hypothetical protein [Crenobacter cavernae]